jgi:hypothetical protein
VRLVPLELWLAPAAGPLLPRLRQALAQACPAGGEPLRWAITAADPQRGLRLEAVLIQPDGAAAEPSGQRTLTPADRP